MTEQESNIKKKMTWADAELRDGFAAAALTGIVQSYMDLDDLRKDLPKIAEIAYELGNGMVIRRKMNKEKYRESRSDEQPTGPARGVWSPPTRR